MLWDNDFRGGLCDLPGKHKIKNVTESRVSVSASISTYISKSNKVAHNLPRNRLYQLYPLVTLQHFEWPSHANFMTGWKQIGTRRL